MAPTARSELQQRLHLLGSWVQVVGSQSLEVSICAGSEQAETSAACTCTSPSSHSTTSPRTKLDEAVCPCCAVDGGLPILPFLARQLLAKQSHHIGQIREGQLLGVGAIRVHDGDDLALHDVAAIQRGQPADWGQASQCASHKDSLKHVGVSVNAELGRCAGVQVANDVALLVHHHFLLRSQVHVRRRHLHTTVV